jgi:hypothetical protein
MRVAKVTVADGLSAIATRSVIVSKRTLAATGSIFGASYINLQQVIYWIRARESVQPVSDYPMAESVLNELRNVIAGEAEPHSWEVVTLLELRTALERGLVKATARRNVPSSWFGGKPRILPAHFWPHLGFVNRDVRQEDSKWPYERTCVCLKDTRGSEFWSHILFRADQVIAVWPAKEADSRGIMEAAILKIPHLRRTSMLQCLRATFVERLMQAFTGLLPKSTMPLRPPVRDLQT